MLEETKAPKKAKKKAAAKKPAAKKAAESTRTKIKHFEKPDADKFVAKIQKDKGFKSASEATTFLIGYAANRMEALARHRKNSAA